MRETASAHRSTITLGVSLKLYLDVASSAAWAGRVADIARTDADVASGAIRLIALPSLPALAAVTDALDGTSVSVGAQDLHWADRGAYTGAVSGADLAEVGCTFVEVGHAERMEHFGEDRDVVRKKLAAAVRNSLVPVLCIGEPTRGNIDDAVAECIDQLAYAMGGIDSEFRTDIVVAYEPVWAIGQPVPAPAEHTIAVCRALREWIAGDARVREGSVIYGGSAQEGTLQSLNGEVDGLFLGRFAHDTESLRRIIEEAKRVLS